MKPLVCAPWEEVEILTVRSTSDQQPILQPVAPVAVWAAVWSTYGVTGGLGASIPRKPVPIRHWLVLTCATSAAYLEDVLLIRNLKIKIKILIASRQSLGLQVGLGNMDFFPLTSKTGTLWTVTMVAFVSVRPCRTVIVLIYLCLSW